MKLVIYSDVLNQHQAPVADELYRLLGDEFCFVELKQSNETKGGVVDYSLRKYMLRAWQSEKKQIKAAEYATTAECCIFAGAKSLPYEKERMKMNLLSFEMGERWLKRGIISLLSPRLLRWLFCFHLYGWKKKPLYKLCCSGFCSKDNRILAAFAGKEYKWGYFTPPAPKFEPKCYQETEPLQIMWCSRFLKWKHPELAVYLASYLKENGYKFHIKMYGFGELLPKVQTEIERLQLNDVIRLKGAANNDVIHAEMRKSDIFIFTSDRNEGWGAVANESLDEGCVLVSSDKIGSSPFLVDDRRTGLRFIGPSASSSIAKPDKASLKSLCEQIVWLLNNTPEFDSIRRNGKALVSTLWSPNQAAGSLLKLINNLKDGKNEGPLTGPCSKV